MPKAVRFQQYGGVEVLQVVDVPRPVPGPGQVLVRVKAAGINRGEAKIREGQLHNRFPATFPSGQGSDLAGVVEEVGPDVSAFSPGDEVLGWSDERASHAELVVVPDGHLVPKAPRAGWEEAGALFVAGTTAYACVNAVNVQGGDTVVVTGAAGGVGSIAVQLARLRGARVIGIASPANHPWLIEQEVRPVAYGPDVEQRILASIDTIDALIDTYGGTYVEMGMRLGADPSRINTTVRFDAVAQYRMKAEGSAAAANTKVLDELAKHVARGRIEIPIAGSYPLSEVQAAFRQLETGHLLGKIVLLPEEG
ncbi:MAG TPA: NADP-dependent oxidoreductase [Acidimicrobiales bacterium]|nr:NADP-dependent oxidoreductase [Acidimicrobiales bacterium]